jgi:hypothetical protein
MMPATAAIAADHVLSAPAGKTDLATRGQLVIDGHDGLVQAT